MTDMSEAVNQLVRDIAGPFLRGEISVVDLTLAFNRSIGEIARERPLHGQEIDLLEALEAWEEAGWDGRPAAFERLRVLAASIAAA